VGRIAEEDIRRVRDATDLVSLVSERVVLKQKGRLYWGCCPFHAEKTPSFKVDPATQLWHCFGCGLGGDAFGFVMRVENVEFVDAVRSLAERAHIELREEEGGVPTGRRNRLIAACEAAADYYHAQLTRGSGSGATHARAYLAGRSFGSDVANRFRLGYAPGRGRLVRELTSRGFSPDEIVAANLGLRGTTGELRDRFYERVMFPIADLQGRCIAFGGRVLGEGEPKYLNTGETPIFSKGRNLYAIDRAKADIVASGSAVVVEGYTDVIAMHEAGLRNVVATLGTALTREHARLLGRFAKRVVYLFDGDEAGLRAADRAAGLIDRALTPEAGRERIELDVAILPAGQDPADFTESKGGDALSDVLASAVPLLRFAIDRRLAAYDLDRPEQRASALADASAILAPVKDSILGHDYANYLADRLFVDFNTAMAAVKRARVQPSTAGEDDEGAAAAADEMRRVCTPEERAEAELLGLLVSRPDLRGGARDLLAENLLTSEEMRFAAELLVAEPDLDVAAVMSRLAAECRGAVDMLAVAVISTEERPEDVVAARELARKLKELDLQRRINAGKAALKRPDELESGAYDEVFREVSALTKELDEVRRGIRDLPFE
jgi:DNA primase